MDYYDLLGVKRSASADELKTAYKRQAMKNHPDKGGDPEKFKQINEAYQALSDPQQKQMYDQFGTTDPQQAQMNSGGFHFTSGAGADFDDILRHFGFAHQFGHGFANQRSRRNKDIRISINLDFKYLYTGKTDSITYRLPSGKTEIIDVRIPPGIRDGDNIKFQGYGDDSIPNIPRGNLIIQVRITGAPNVQRDRSHLFMKLDIDVFDCICGSTKKIKTPEGKEISITIPKGTQPNTVLSISEHGLPDFNTQKRGNLHLEINCKIPNLDDDAINNIKKLIDKF
jgi:curved DNA-binding protein